MTERSVLVRLRADVSDFNRKMAEAGAVGKGLADRLDSADGRMANLVQTGLALGPALVPIGAAVIPAISGITAALGFAAVGAGVTVLAFQGIGKGLTALNTYQLTPTAANFKKLQDTLNALGPAGQDFVFFLQDLRPQLQELQNIAQAGMLPGVQAGIDQLMTRMPEVQDIIARVSTTLGDLVHSAGNNLADPRWTKFFNYIRDEASPALKDMGIAAGNIFEGITNMVMAFDPLNDDFFNTIVRISGAFKDWSANLQGSASFTDFLNYVQQVGPEVWSTLGKVAEALISIVTAAAPVGQVTLRIITALADGISALADSSIGPGIIAIASAIGILGRSLALLDAVGLRGGKGDSFLEKKFINPGKGVVSAFRDMSKASEAFVVSEGKVQKAHARLESALNSGSLTNVAKAQGKLEAANEKQAKAAERVASAEKDKGKALREGLGAAGKAAGVAAGLALASSGLADNFGLANTASLAMMGTLGGPWGVALGGAVGFAEDLMSANNDLTDSIDRANAALKNPIDLTGQISALSAARKASSDYDQSIRDAYDPTKLGSIKGTFNLLTDGITQDSKKAHDTIDKLSSSTLQLQTNMSDLAISISGAKGGAWTQLDLGLQSAQDLATKLAPALEHAGISTDILNKAMSKSDKAMVLSAWHDWVGTMDSAAGRSQTAGQAMAALAGQMSDASTEADTLKTALDNLFGPGLDLSAANDKYTQSLKDLRAALKGAKGDLLGNSDAALKARDATRNVVSAMEAKAVADAKVHQSGARVAGILIKGRDAMIEQGRAAGIAKGDMQNYLRTLGLTPKNLITVIKTPGLLNAQQQAIALGRIYGLTPKEVRTLISQPGMHNSKSEIDALTRKYHLTPKQVSTLLKAVDQASGVIRAAQVRLREFNGSTATSYIRVVTQHQVVNIPGITKPRVTNAAGNLFSATRYDMGDVRNAHPPMIAQGSKNWRLWAEEETKGESYIPHANDWRRPRAIAIWEETGRILGQQVQRYAAGSAVRSAVPSSNYITVSSAGSSGPMQITGTLNTPFGVAQIRGIAQQEAAAAVDGGRRQDAMNRRARGK